MNLEKGKSFDIAKSVIAQLPFFACKDIVLDGQAQKDISKYMYCSNFGISPYKGSYGDQPKRWVDKSFLIKKSMNSVTQKDENNG